MLLVAGSVFFVVIHRRLVADFDRMLIAAADVLARNAERKGRTIVWDVPDAFSRGSWESADPPFCQLFLENRNAAELRLVLVVARSRERLDRLLVSLLVAGVAVAVALSCALAWLVRWSVARGLRPIEEINAQLAAITPDALATRLHVAERECWRRAAAAAQSQRLDFADHLPPDLTVECNADKLGVFFIFRPKAIFSSTVRWGKSA